MLSREGRQDRGLVCGLLLPWLAGAACVVGLLLALPVVALGQTPAPCPDVPAVYGGTDEVVNELRAARTDAQLACVAQLERLDQAADELAGARADLAAIDAELDPLDVIATNTEPEAQVPADTAAVVAAVDEAQLELDAALWFLAGLLCALASGGMLAREVLS